MAAERRGGRPRHPLSHGFVPSTWVPVHITHALVIFVVEHTIAWLQERYALRVCVVCVPVPLTSEGLLLVFESTLRSIEGSIKMAVIDHISSKPAYVLPILDLVGWLGLEKPSGYSAPVEGAPVQSVWGAARVC
jgi:hypothetical protein